MKTGLSKRIRKMNFLSGLRRAAQKPNLSFKGYNLKRLYGADESKLIEQAREQNLNRRGYNKVFVIGFNKTGTTSLREILMNIGFRVANQQDQEKHLTHILSTGRYDALQEFAAKYDAFQDLPFSQGHFYVACDALFPNSKFILTVRNTDEWFESLLRFHKKVFGFDDETSIDLDFAKDKALYLHKNYTYEQFVRRALVVNGTDVEPDSSKLYDREQNVRRYEERNEAILKYFYNRPSDLLVLDLSAEEDTSKICSFLELSNDTVQPMPQENRTR